MIRNSRLPGFYKLSVEQRRELLTQVLEPGSNWTVPAHRVGGGAELLAATDRQSQVTSGSR